MTRIEIKQKAREQLGGSLFGNNWLYALLACFAVSLILSFVSATVVGTFILAGPLTFGLNSLFLKQTRDGQKMDIAGLFKGFTDDFTGNLLLGFLNVLFVFLWSLLFVVPGIVKSYAYSMCFYIKVDHPEYDCKTCISESEKMMKGHKADLFVQDLSFIGWFILGSLACGIGTLWVVPYSLAARSQFYESIRNCPEIA